MFLVNIFGTTLGVIISLINILIAAMSCFYICLLFLLTIKFLHKIQFLPYYKNSSKTITSLHFLPYVKLPKDRDFFKKTLIKHNKFFFSTVLPVIDLNDYDFEDVDITNCRFHKNSILPKDTEFFQKIKDKSLADCKLPSGDYSKYNFKGVCLTRCTFTKDSKLPLNYTFFTDLKNHNFIQVKLPNSFSKYCHLYDLSDVQLVLPRKISISKEQTAILFFKNQSRLPSFVKNKEIKV